MPNIIAKQYTKQGNVLFHPHFDRPAVKNPVIRGKKKGCISFAVVSRKRVSDQLLKESYRTQRVADHISGLLCIDDAQALNMASAALAKYKEMSNGLQASK